MIISSKKLFILTTILILKILSGFFYFYYFESFGFDYIEVFNTYCLENRLEEKSQYFDILNTSHEIIFSKFCFLSINYYFWIFFLLQLILFISVFSRFYDYFKENSHSRNLVLVVFLSPTLQLFSSAPTKDGFFVFLTLLIVSLSKHLSKLSILIPCLLKPYYFFLYFEIKKIWFFIVFGIINIVLYYFDFYNEINRLIDKKLSVSKFNIFYEIELTEIIWSLEFLIILLFSMFSNIISKKSLIIILIFSILGAGYNLNVGSRVFSLGIFYLLSLSYVHKK